jgi:hypothetical protein
VRGTVYTGAEPDAPTTGHERLKSHPEDLMIERAASRLVNRPRDKGAQLLEQAA